MKAGPEEGRGDQQAHAVGGGSGRQGRKDDLSPTLRGLDTGLRGRMCPRSAESRLRFLRKELTDLH